MERLYHVETTQSMGMDKILEEEEFYKTGNYHPPRLDKTEQRRDHTRQCFDLRHRQSIRVPGDPFMKDRHAGLHHGYAVNMMGELQINVTLGDNVFDTVRVFQASTHDVGENLRIVMRVSGKASSRLDHVVIHDDKRMKPIVLFVVIVGEGESKPGVKPSMFGYASFTTGSFFKVHDNNLTVRRVSSKLVVEKGTRMPTLPPPRGKDSYKSGRLK